MKRLLVVTSLSVLALLATASLTSAALPFRAAPADFTASTTPKRDTTAPYTFKTSGKLTPPAFCAAGASGGGSCIPVICPAGTTNAAYCTQPPQRMICRGVVTVRFSKGGNTISTRNVGLKPDCTYSSSVTFRSRSPLRRGVLTVSARFQGNVLLQPKTAPTYTVQAG